MRFKMLSSQKESGMSNFLNTLGREINDVTEETVEPIMTFLISVLYIITGGWIAEYLIKNGFVLSGIFFAIPAFLIIAPFGLVCGVIWGLLHFIGDVLEEL